MAVAAERSAVHLPIGGDALDRLRAKRDAMCRETDGWEDVTRSTDVPAGASA